MTERTDFLKKRLLDSQASVSALFDRVGERWEMPVYTDGAGWNARQVVVHLADAERGLIAQMRRIAAGEPSGVTDDFDIDRYNKRAVEKRAEMTLAQAREAMAANRADLVAWLDTLDDATLERSGRHPTLGNITLDMYARVIARHEKDHARDLARALGIDAEV